MGPNPGNNGCMGETTPLPEAFACLVAAAQSCRACPRMEGRRRLLSAANGALRPRVLFVAEAPGRLGGERTAIPLAGDQSGRNFDRLLAAAGRERWRVVAPEVGATWTL